MKPLICLLVVFLLSATISKVAFGDWNLTWSGNLAMFVMLCFTALGHFKFTNGMAMMVPQVIPFKTQIIYMTGVVEILFGLGLLFPKVRVLVGFVWIIFFVLMLPANIYASLNRVNYETATFDGPGMSYLWFRVPMQLFLIGWVYYFSILRH